MNLNVAGYSLLPVLPEIALTVGAMVLLMVGTFSALDLVLFYLFFEGGLIPMFLIIGVWGGPRRVYASFKFFLYTLLGSVLMLLAILWMYLYAGTTDIETLLNSAPETMPCEIIWKMPPATPCVVAAKMPMVTKPMCATEE